MRACAGTELYVLNMSRFVFVACAHKDQPALHSCGLYRYGLYRYGLYSYGLYSDGLYIVMAYIVVACMVMAHIVVARTRTNQRSDAYHMSRLPPPHRTIEWSRVTMP